MQQITTDMVEAAYKAVPGLGGLLIQRALLKGAFDLVANRKDWKAPINTYLGDYVDSTYSADVIVQAVLFFTGTECTYTREGTGYRFESVGYRAGPCGP